MIHISITLYTMETPGRVWGDTRECRRHLPSFTLTSSVIVDRDTVKPMPQTLLLLQSFMSLFHEVCGFTLKVRPFLKPSSIFRNNKLYNDDPYAAIGTGWVGVIEGIANSVCVYHGIIKH